MDTDNESRGGREDRVEETHILQVEAPVSDNLHSGPDLGHERQMTPSSSIERPLGDAGQGERVKSGICTVETCDVVKGNGDDMLKHASKSFHFD